MPRFNQVVVGMKKSSMMPKSPTTAAAPRISLNTQVRSSRRAGQKTRPYR
jgi:hypothetical protein